MFKERKDLEEFVFYPEIEEKGSPNFSFWKIILAVKWKTNLKAEKVSIKSKNNNS